MGEVYSIRKLNGQWKVNKTIYDVCGEKGEKLCLVPYWERYNPLKHKYFVYKHKGDIFPSYELAQEACNRRNFDYN